MPKYVIPIPRVFETVTRPLIKKLTEEVCVQFNIPPSCEFVFYGRASGIPINNSTVDTGNSSLRLDTEHRISVEYEEEVMNPFEVTVLRRNERFIFLDTELRTWLKPVKVPMKLTVNFEYIAPDRNSATEWRQQAQLNSYRMANQFNFDADFHYYIPNGVAMQLVRIHTLREASQVPLNESLGEWFSRCYSDTMTVLSDLSGRRTRHAIATKLVALQALIDMKYDIAPVEKDNPAGTWKTNFSITLYYDRPDDIVMGYPLMIHNQLIPKKYREDNPTSLVDRSEVLGNPNLHQADLAMFESRNRARYLDRFTNGIKLPAFDDWIHTYQLRDHTCVSTLLIALSPTEPHWLFTFTDEFLGDYRFSTRAKNFMQRSGYSMFIPNDSVINISLHCWDDLMPGNILTIDRGLRLETTETLDPTKMYHLVVTLLTDLSKLSDKGWEDLENEPGFLEDIVDSLYPDKDNQPEFPKNDPDYDPDDPDKNVPPFDPNRPDDGNDKDTGLKDSILDTVDPVRGLVNAYSIVTKRKG